VQIEVVADAGKSRVERQLHDRIGRNRKAFGIAGRIDGRRLGSDSQMGMQAQTGHLNTAALQQWTAKRQRQADRVAIDIVA